MVYSTNTYKQLMKTMLRNIHILLGENFNGSVYVTKPKKIISSLV